MSNITESGALVTWSAPGPPYISAHAYWIIYWPELDVNSTYVIRHVTTNVTQRYVDNLQTATLYNFRVSLPRLHQRNKLRAT